MRRSNDRDKIVTGASPKISGLRPGVKNGLIIVAAVLLLLMIGMTSYASMNPMAPAASSTSAPAVAPTILDVVAPPSPEPTLKPRIISHPTSAPKATPDQPARVAYQPPPPPEQAPAPAPVVPRVLTAVELSSSKMTIAGPPPAETVSGGGAEMPVSATAQPISGPHSSFFAQQGGGEIGYEPDRSGCVVRATSAISARLVTHVDSELPGGVVKAQIVRPVNCADGDEAIPAGAVLQGTYDSGTVAGESRLLAVFTRIIFPPSQEHPNGRAYAISTQSATDALGGTGLSGKVNTHTGRALGQALIYTVLGAAGSTLGNVGRHGTTIGLGGSSLAGQFGGQSAAQKPTIYANPGDPVDVVLSRDLPMEATRE